MPSKELTTTIVSEMLGDGAIQVELTLPLRPRRQESAKGGRSDQVSVTGGPSRIPRITRLMALAIKFEKMVEHGEVRDYADLARLGYVTRARMTQIMGLLNLAPDIQDALISLGKCGEEIRERQLRPIVAIADWREQRQHWLRLKDAPPVVSPTFRPVR
jgi:hypothetical protein